MQADSSTPRVSPSRVLLRTSTRANGRRSHRRGRWGIVVALACLLFSLTVHTAGALPYDARGADGGWRPDNNDHTFCLGVNPFPDEFFWNALHGMANLDDQTVMYDTYVGACTAVTDVVLTYVNSDRVGWAGYYTCDQANSANECERSTARINGYQMFGQSWDYSATSCHEVGHSVGLSHGFVGNCMMPSAFTHNEWYFQFYDQDQVRQINCRCQ